VLDREQSENPEWYGNADNPPLLNPDFDIHGEGIASPTKWIVMVTAQLSRILTPMI
jgi:hypothetical protein